MDDNIRFCWMHFMQILAGTITFEEMIKLYPQIAAECPQIRGVEVFHSDFLDKDGRIDTALMRHFIGVVRDLEWEVPVVDIPIPIARDGKKSYPEIWKALVIANALGAKVAHIVGAIDAKDMDPDTAQGRLIDGLLEAKKLASPMSLITAIEDFGFAANWLCRHADVMKVLNADPDFMYVMDTGNKHAVGESIVDAYADVRQRVVHVHFKDWAKPPKDGEFPGCHLGAGVVAQDNAVIAKRLLDDRYRGWISYEGPLEADASEPLRSLVPAMRVMEKLFE